MDKPRFALAHYLWAMLIARIYEIFLQLCLMCGGQIRLIAFITYSAYSAEIRQTLDHIGADSEPPHISPACGPPLWDDCCAQPETGCEASRNGIWQRNWHRATTSIRALTGEQSKRRFRCAARQAASSPDRLAANTLAIQRLQPLKLRRSRVRGRPKSV